MRSLRSSLPGLLRSGGCVLLLSSLAISAAAVPPTKDDKAKADPAKQDEPHPADGRVAEKIVGASEEGKQAMSAFKKPEGWQVSLFAAEPELANPVALFVDRSWRDPLGKSARERFEIGLRDGGECGCRLFVCGATRLSTSE